ncbi:hypothetical protein VTL71DRAFT_466 [Oculimacula yallundae]|uniref:Uncharacterized protein n=1 Tax=Oculimacula yallundae TaxID=86028 RepID=A0ABR4D056_9HELO
MPSSEHQNVIQEPTPLRPMPSINLRDSLQVPTDTRPISQQTTYTDRTSRRGSLESSPPHLAPGEDAQIMTARQINFRPQAPSTPPPSPPLLERPGGPKKWVAWCLVGSAATVIVLLLVTIAILVFFGLKNHSSSRVYIKAAPHTSIGQDTSTLTIPSSMVSQSRSTVYPPTVTLEAVRSELFTLLASAVETGGISSAEVPATIVTTRMMDSLAQVQEVGTTANMITTEVPYTTTITTSVLDSTTVTITVTSQPLFSTMFATVTVERRFTVANSGRVPFRIPVALLVILLAVIVLVRVISDGGSLLW